jgi:hypothetical protein
MTPDYADRANIYASLIQQPDSFPLKSFLKQYKINYIVIPAQNVSRFASVASGLVAGIEYCGNYAIVTITG